ncbi:MAG: hypothetical protein SCALA702_00120 [Melioribacteraceae bacterium]|nr:MAG: hypothetical protein SCALA702_00120 [Melioribacteraceae bacterium]
MDTIFTSLSILFPNSLIKQIKKSNYYIDGIHYHTRLKSRPSSGSKYPFNINPGTLAAEFEILLFGEHNWAYIVPIKVLENMYEHPEAYIDNHHPNIRIYTMDAVSGEATYAKGGLKIDFSNYKKYF